MVLNLPLNLQKSIRIVSEFSSVETTPLFDVCILQQVYSRSGRLGPLVKLAWFTEVQSPKGWMKWKNLEGQGS